MWPHPEPRPRRPQAVVLEGNYWKRRIEVVMREYHKWRIYYKKRVSGGPWWEPQLPRHCRPPTLQKALADSATVWPRGLLATCLLPRAAGGLAQKGDPWDGMARGGDREGTQCATLSLQLRKSIREGDLLAPKQVGAA